jgi:serine phosphatase RsbU (regulator of sigma subunit)
MSDQPDAHATFGRTVAAFFDASHRVRPHDLPDLIAEAVVALGGRSARVWLADHQLRFLCHLTDGTPEGPIPIDGTAAGRTFISVEPIDHDHADGTHHLWLPLRDGVDRVGVLEVRSDGLDEGQCRALAHLAAVATAEIITRGQYTDLFNLARRRKDMSLAAELQWQLLPPGTFATDEISVAGLMEPAYAIGGDAFDYAHDRDRLRFAIFDAVGHDLTSSTISSLTVGAYRNARRLGKTLVETAEHIDRAVAGQLGAGAFATGQLAEFDTASGLLRWINAGHPPPMLIRQGHVSTLDCRPRLPLGLGHHQADHQTTVAEEHLEPGDGILLYSDGVIEARRVHGVDFGMDRLEDFLQKANAAGLHVAETLRRLSNAVLDFHGGDLQDDATTLLVVWHPDR